MGLLQFSKHVQQSTLNQGRVQIQFLQFSQQEPDRIQYALASQAGKVGGFQQKMVGCSPRQVPDESEVGREEGVDLVGKLVNGEGEE
jgi:hypothetical protein